MVTIQHSTEFLFGPRMKGHWGNFRDCHGLANDNLTQNDVRGMQDAVADLFEKGWDDLARGALDELTAMKWTLKHFQRKNMRAV